MKLAVQCIASHSVATALRWCVANSLPGFDDNKEDVQATADCIDLLDKTFDILNTRSVLSKGYKRPLRTSPACLMAVEEVFVPCKEMLLSLEQVNGDKIMDGVRRTGPLGLLCCLQVVRRLLSEMANRSLNLNYLLTYKMSQDHIELFFGAVRLRNGCAFNPTSRQFRTAFRRLLLHAGRSVIATNGNCEALDSTSIISLPWRTAAATSDLTDSTSTCTDMSVEVDYEMPHASGCFVKHCEVCSNMVTYISGFLARALAAKLPCANCSAALFHSAIDPCPARLLISLKNYRMQDMSTYTAESQGLAFPSGSLVRVVLEAESQLRHHRFRLAAKNCVWKIVQLTLIKMAQERELFPSISHHLYDAEGADSHLWLLIKLIVRRYSVCRVRKMCRDMQIRRGKDGLGNKLQRTRIFKNC